MADERQTDGWVDTVSPLMVLTLGAETPCPATLATEDTITANAHVRVTVSDPQPPTVTGVVKPAGV